MSKPQCKCIEQSNDLLKEHNTRIRTDLCFSIGEKSASMSGAVIETEKLDSAKRAKKKTVFATYCPICGKQYCD